MFKESFKYYKSKRNPANLNEVLIFDEINSNFDNYQVQKIELKNAENVNVSFNHLNSVNEWKIYRIGSAPGIIFIRNPFTCLGQRYWITRCLRDFSKKPNKLNLDIHSDIDFGLDWWKFCESTDDVSLLKKLRWATLGYHHNWDTKVYAEESKGIFPDDLAFLTHYIATLLGFDDFKAEAAIVNYYHMDSTLSGHTDHSEQNLNAPLFSFSFGQSAIFLIGGETVETKPVPILLQSGDILVMSKQSRVCYHGVPKILPAVQNSWLENEDLHHVTLCDKLDDLMYGLTECKVPQGQISNNPIMSYIFTDTIHNLLAKKHFKQCLAAMGW